MNEFGDIFENFFGKATTPNSKPKPEARPIPPIRGKRIDGVFYVRAEDIANALESQAPEINKRLIAKLRAI